MTTTANGADWQARCDLEEASARLARLHELVRATEACQEIEDDAAAAYRRARAARKEAQARLSAALTADARPLPLFDRPREPEPEAPPAEPGPMWGRLQAAGLAALGISAADRERLEANDLFSVGDLVAVAFHQKLPLAQALPQHVAHPECFHDGALADVAARTLRHLEGYYPAGEGPRCRACRCTEDDCSLCVARTGRPCSWAEPDLCSACAGYMHPPVPEEDRPEKPARRRKAKGATS